MEVADNLGPAEECRSARYERSRYVRGLAVLVAGLALSAIAAWNAHTREQRVLQADFDAAADNRVSALRRELDSQLAALEALGRTLERTSAQRRPLLLALAAQANSAGRFQFQWVPAANGGQMSLCETAGASEGEIRGDAMRRAAATSTLAMNAPVALHTGEEFLLSTGRPRCSEGSADQ